MADVIWDQHMVAIWQELQNAEKEEWVKALYFLGIPRLPRSKINDHLTAKVLANKHAIIYLYHPPYSEVLSRSSSLHIQGLLRNMCRIRPQRPEQGRLKALTKSVADLCAVDCKERSGLSQQGVFYVINKILKVSSAYSWSQEDHFWKSVCCMIYAEFTSWKAKKFGNRSCAYSMKVHVVLH